MKIYESLESLPELPSPVILTIGQFDGVHLGHQKILMQVRDLAHIDSIPSTIFTFKNHPSKILHPNHPVSLLTTFAQKMELIEKLGIDIVIAVEFTKIFSEQYAETFLKKLLNKLVFRRLILGYDAKIGHDRQGKTPLMHELSQKLHFQLEFLDPVLLHGQPISSSRIRQAIHEADFALAEECLGRLYIVEGVSKIESPQIFSVNLPDICLPAQGIYNVMVAGKAAYCVTNPFSGLKIYHERSYQPEKMVKIQFEAYRSPYPLISEEEMVKWLNLT